MSKLRFSIFTPTHNLKYLRRAAISLNEQSFRDFEWVIVPNGPVVPKDVEDMFEDFGEMREGINLRIVKMPDAINKPIIGQIKKFACDSCEGEYLIELDHDDELTPDCLEKLNEAIENEEPDFIYSESVGIYPDGSSLTYAPDCGWDPDPTPYTWKNRLYRYQSIPTATALSLCEIYWAPHHVRVWKKSFYDSIGGYDRTFEISDDHNLIVRSYIAGGKFLKIPEVLYIYHMHEQNSHHAEFTSYDKSCDNFNEYLDDLIVEWCRREGLEDILFDIDNDFEKLKSMPDNSAGRITFKESFIDLPICLDRDCTHDDVTCHVGLMNECHRVIARQGFLALDVPKVPSATSYWTVRTMMPFFDYEERRYRGLAEPREHACRKWHPKELAFKETKNRLKLLLVPMKSIGEYDSSPLFNPWFEFYDDKDELKYPNGVVDKQP